MTQTKDLTEQNSSKRLGRLSFKSLLVIMIVVGVAAASIAHLIRGAQGQETSLGFFVLFTSIAPLGVMVILSWLFKLFSGRIK